MSVGVCIINRNGIALAADSAGTFSPTKMFYNSVNKLIPLSRKNALGAIVYADLSIYNVSIEQILKEFSVFLDSQNSIKDFYEIIQLFKDFMRKNYNYYKFNEDEIPYCKRVISAYVNVWGKQIQDVADEDNAKQKINNILTRIGINLKNSNLINDFQICDYIKNNYEHFFDIEINKAVPDIDSFVSEKELLWQYICKAFCIDKPLTTDSKTGLLFAGYGSNDAYPKFINIDLFKILNGEIKYREIEKREARDNYAQIKPLAQDDIIYTFCKGISEDYITSIPIEVDTLIKNRIKSLPSTYTDSQKQELLLLMSDCQSKISAKINEISQQKNIQPIMKSVKLISLSEMAFLAENLVNMTSLKRTYCLDGQQQTVGGPTDVAILSKGDGFTWIKCKNSFKI